MRFETSDTVSKACKVLSGLSFLMACSADAQVRAPEKPVTVHVTIFSPSTMDGVSTWASMKQAPSVPYDSTGPASAFFFATFTPK
jgi:hypothetical protein